MTIETYYPHLNVKHLLDKIRQEALRQNLHLGVPSAPLPPPPAATRELVLKGDFDREAINNQIDYIEGFIKTAESRAAVRNQLPEKFGRFPWLLFKPLQALALKILNTIFRDQREVNFNLASALRECLQLNRQLLSEVESLRSQSQRDLENLMAVSQSLSGYSQAVEKNLVNNTQNLEEKLHNFECQTKEREVRIQDYFQQRLQALQSQYQDQLQILDQRWGDIGNHIQEQTQEQLQDIERKWGDIGNHIQEQTQEQLQNLDRKWGDIGNHIQEQTQEQLQNLDQKWKELADLGQEKLERQIRESEERSFQNIHYLQIDLIQQKRWLGKFWEGGIAQLPQPLSSELKPAITTELDHSLDAFYAAFEERFRGSRAVIHQRLAVYLPLLKEAQIAPGDSLVLDLGCGRGEWLELLRQNGYKALGIDLNQVVVAECQQRGLDVREADIIDYLQSLEDNSVALVTGFHLIEHLPFEILMKLLSESFRVLRPRGMVIFETPNPANVLIGSCNFYFDPTHRNPLPSLMTQFLAKYSGFSPVNILNLNPSTETPIAEDSETAKRFNEYFYGPMDYAIIGYKL
ncbi:MAG: methyltransferase domain-containing protein [Microcystis aeruginosa Ma_OC_H_19870700_S124]|uniref:Methyltransferase domain-containing protein n=1 Tax=Microcystis aeruginosa Ma_OC_H_19870700_S124 TaxID=2486262 RepID=A0A552AV20_MICAE|nr:methyltransferase domain-containing protein [Burkholderiales bacterium]TRT89274.1 MAG: methyltransferase domain-containing protein [Microcystis aeruginosa Ma_OC_H_19870700_S124]